MNRDCQVLDCDKKAYVGITHDTSGYREDMTLQWLCFDHWEHEKAYSSLHNQPIDVERIR